MILLDSFSIKELILFHIFCCLFHVFEELLRRFLNLFLILKNLLHQVFVIEREFLALPDFIEEHINQTGRVCLLVNEFLKPSLFGFLPRSECVV